MNLHHRQEFMGPSWRVRLAGKVTPALSLETAKNVTVPPQALMKTTQNEPFSVNRLAELTGLDRRKLKTLLATLQPNKTVNGSPQYGLGAALRMILAEASSPPSDAPEISIERTRLLSAQASREEIALEVDRGTYVDKDLFVLAWAEITVDFRHRITALPGAVSGQLVGQPLPIIQSILSREIDRCLNDLSAADVAQPIDRALEKFQKLHPENIIEK